MRVPSCCVWGSKRGWKVSGGDHFKRFELCDENKCFSFRDHEFGSDVVDPFIGLFFTVMVCKFPRPLDVVGVFEGDERAVSEGVFGSFFEDLSILGFVCSVVHVSFSFPVFVVRVSCLCVIQIAIRCILGVYRKLDWGSRIG